MSQPTWKYSFDSSAFIDSWRRYYPRDVFPRVWEFLTELIQRGLILSNRIVKNEIDIQEDDLTEFCNQFNEIFILPDEEIQDCVTSLVNNAKFDKWGISEQHQADPFVVGIGQKYKLIVVSYENVHATKNSIPAACRELGITHMNFVEFLRAENFIEKTP